MIVSLIVWVVALALNAALGLQIAGLPHATAAGWLAFAAGSLLWVAFTSWLCLIPERLR